MGLISTTGPYNAAADAFGADDEIHRKLPRLKYQYQVELTVDSAAPYTDDSGGRTFIFDRVRGVSLPDYQYNVSRVNQYNKMRYITTRLEPTPMTVEFYDTRDNQFQNLYTAYSSYYTHGHNQGAALTYDTVTGGFQDYAGVKAVSGGNKYFFPVIRVITTDTADSGRVIELVNCTIISVSHDRLDYSDSNPVVWSVQFQPEQVNFL